MKLVTLAAATLIVTVVVARPKPVAGCAVATRVNEPVRIADETAVVVWDAATHTEHFVRRASFVTRAADFGFLVPMPTPPDLGELPDAVFQSLQRLTAPGVVTKWVEVESGLSCGGRMPPQSAGVGAVEVVREQRVAGFDAAVLRADDPTALTAWLRDRGYTYDPALSDWVADYVHRGWAITAFKIAKAGGAAGVTTAAVRMSFRTDAPFYPYKEPERTDPAGAGEGRLLRVFFLGEGKVAGRIGPLGNVWQWPGRLVHSAPVTDGLAELCRKVRLDLGANRTWWLTEFEDASSPRPAKDDVYFTPTGDTVAVRRTPHVTVLYTAGPPDCCFLTTAAGFVAFAVARRAKRRV